MSQTTHRFSRVLGQAAVVLLSAGALGSAACETADPIPTEPPGERWVMVWSDEFEGPAGQLPDATKWTFDVGGGGWGNNQLEYDTDRPENASLDGEGNLAITARAESYQGNDYTSARLKTQGLFERAYGRFEARIQLPLGAGLWPAFWLLGADIAEVGWPECGEIDVMEYRGQEPWAAHGAMHGPGYSGGDPLSGSFLLDGDDTFANGFHTFAVEWDPSRVAWSVDGTVYFVATPTQLGDRRWVFNHPFFILVNLAVGGNYVGPPDPSVFPATMLVDYVRVFERAGAQ